MNRKRQTTGPRPIPGHPPLRRQFPNCSPQASLFSAKPEALQERPSVLHYVARSAPIAAPVIGKVKIAGDWYDVTEDINEHCDGIANWGKQRILNFVPIIPLARVVTYREGPRCHCKSQGPKKHFTDECEHILALVTAGFFPELALLKIVGTVDFEGSDLW